MELRFELKQLHLKETFSIAYGNYNKRDALLIELSHQNCNGFGECVAIDYYQIDFQSFVLKLKEIKPKIEVQKIIHPKDFFKFLLNLNLHPFLLSALDCAYWDLFGKLENKSFIELNQIPSENSVESSITISVASVEDQIKKIEKSGWNKFKVKCKSLNKNDVERLLKLNRNIALDSNASFTDEDCIWLQKNTEVQKFSYLEQPRPIDNYHVLKKESFANWMADEDCQNIDSLDELVPYYKSINIKLMKCGGLTPALEMIKKARELNYKIMIGCMTESTVGISAGCALTGLVDYADLDGANLISNDYATGNFVENGKIILSQKPGLGIELK
ncbi:MULTISPECIES: enolase C-terminal domain-like protein [Chryseobacterium]|uniref:L-alanine-DL-glutamate epimerase-like enolase superfamily enzyme n=1 Tax=Chryseobacterium geocarposphaerae TaxID=1416776 RepID=A0ABU1LIM0_9FLAO|nr:MULTISPECIES: enolase C-terminal domain-like protein [Chryseobacterium]MDR6406415.1 L-alanine-DL-glutamate epimerase-like enolase superfamily enzyme [Chryseobacterium geocarposphaerae]MDR6699146.1 L-alanine-DL-glutamate epimerase-like enolase superfamily enzyme [Chryseobacterium ginsenosidimutans]